MVKRTLPGISTRWRAYDRLLRNKKSFLFSSGWLRSLRHNKPVDKNENPVPWMNYAIVSLLEEKLSKDLALFEYGSGYSTFFYAKRVRSVVSIEYDRQWYDLIKDDAPDNVELRYKVKDIDGEYCRMSATSEDKYDVVVVDGRDRFNCLKQCIPTLSDKGVILLDDSDRSRYEEGIEYVIGQGFKALHIVGIVLAGIMLNRTTIFYRPGNCLNI